MFSRRVFIKSAASAGLLSLVSPVNLFAQRRNSEIGIQLYTIRDLVNEDFMGSLEKLAKIGYKTIETANYENGEFYGYKPKEFIKVLKGFGLKPLSCHCSVNRDNIIDIAENAYAANMKYIVLPWISPKQRRSINDYMRLAEDLNYIGEKAKEAGLTFAYHNHDFEFTSLENQIPYDILLNETNPEWVTMQMDTYWVVYGGYSPTEYFEKYPGRFKLLHVKDMVDGDERISTEIGNGKINFVEIFKKRELAGTEHIFLEQEHFEMDPWESLEISFNYLEDILR